jgi:predicted HTH domain antitoxin
MTATLEIKIPDGVKLSDFDIKMTLAAKLYEDGTLSGGQAAEMAGVSKRTFIEILGKYGVSVFGYDADELQEDLRNLDDKLSIKERIKIVEELAGIAVAVNGKNSQTETEWRDARTDYLIEKYR